MMCSDSLNVTSLGSGAVKAQWTIAFTLSSSYEYLLSCAMAGVFAAKVMIIPNTFLLNSCRIRKKSLSLWKRKSYMISVTGFLILLIVIFALFALIVWLGVKWCIDNDITPLGWHWKE